MKTPCPSLIERVAIRSREYRDEADYERIRHLLIESYTLTDRQFNWQLDRLETMRFAGHAQEELSGARLWPREIRLWEAEGGKLVGAVLNEGPGDFYLQVHPHYRHIEDEMLGWLEGDARLGLPAEAAAGVVRVYAGAGDAVRAALLVRRGYSDLGAVEAFRTRSLSVPLPIAPLANGYTIRTVRLDDDTEMARLADTMSRTFDRTRWAAETARLTARAATYRQNLDLVVEAADGTLAAFCTVWYDCVNRVGVFEPVGVHPNHRRRGLASAMMVEAMRRVKAVGGKKVHVNTGANMDANALYAALGFTDVDLVCQWRKDVTATPS